MPYSPRGQAHPRDRVPPARGVGPGGMAPARSCATQACQPFEPRGVESSARPAGPRRHPAGAGSEPRARHRRDPPYADGGIPVSVFPRSGGTNGLGSGPHADDGHPGAGMRRRPPAELRPLRRARSAPRVRRERLRRDAARIVRVGRQAVGRERCCRRPRSRFRRFARTCGGARLSEGLPHSDAALRRDELPRRLVLADRCRRPGSNL